jgi:hypothetical protein
MKIQLLTQKERRSAAGFLMPCSVCGDKPALYAIGGERYTHIVCEGCKRLTLMVVANVAVGRSHS